MVFLKKGLKNEVSIG